MKTKNTGSEAPRLYENVDKLLHEPRRLAIMATLCSRPEEFAFNELRSACNLTEGNLSAHLKALAEAGAVEMRKEFVGVKPRTTIKPSAVGRERLVAYLGVLDSIVKDAGRKIMRSLPATQSEPIPVDVRRSLTGRSARLM